MTLDPLVVVWALGGSVSGRHVVAPGPGHRRGAAASPLGAALDLIAEIHAPARATAQFEASREFPWREMRAELKRLLRGAT